MRDGRRTARVPTRTRSCPPATATSRSPLMPIEHTGSPSSSTSGATSRTPAACRLGSAVGRADRHQPVDVEPGVARVRRRARRRRRAGSRPCRLAGRVDLDQHRGARGPPGDLVDERRPVDRLPHVDDAGELAHLVRLQLADEVHGDAGVAASRRPWRPAPGRSSRRSPCSRPPTRGRDRVGAEALGDGEHARRVGTAGGRDARPMPRPATARRRAGLERRSSAAGTTGRRSRRRRRRRADRRRPRRTAR